jgi:hypothetical protein
MDECIHGFDPAMCANCSPAAEPEKPLVTRRTTLKPASLRTPSADASGKTAAAKGPNLPSRIFHVTHVDNLAGILGDGSIKPTVVAEPAVKLGSSITDELRGTAQAGPDVSVADCVPFSLSPQATWWTEVQQGAAGPTWSDQARNATITDFVVLGVPVEAVADRLVVTDGDAAALVTTISTPDTVERMLSRAAGSPSALQAAEALVPGEVELDAVALVAVANDKRRAEVRELLAEAGLGAKVVVYPPWFVPVELD